MKNTNNSKKTKRRRNCAELSFKNEDIVITDPCYLISARDDWLGVCDVLERDSSPQKAPKWCGKMIMASTIFGDWFCELHDGDPTVELGTFGADSGTVCVAAVTDGICSRLDWLTPELYTVIRDFTGKAKIVHARGECYVDIRGKSGDREFHAWSRQIG